MSALYAQANDLKEAAKLVRSRRPDLAARLESQAKSLTRRGRRDERVATSGPRPLTVRQHQLYTFLWTFRSEHGYAPSFDEIAAHFGYSSLATVHEALTRIEHKGWVRRDYNLSRSIDLLVELPLKPTQAVA